MTKRSHSTPSRSMHARHRRRRGDISAARLAALVPLALIAGLWSTGVRAAPPTSDEQALLERFAPALAVRDQQESCGDGERFLPVEVDAVLGREDVVLRNADGAVVATAPTAADLAGGGADLWLDLPGDALDPGCAYEQWFDTLDAAPSMYGRLTTQDGRLVAQYWFFWVYNQWNDVHEGDWEMVQLVFETTSPSAALASGPTTYAYAQHEGSQYVTVGEHDEGLTLVDSTHPVVYAAQGSHAAYFSPSRWFGKSAATGFGCDDTTGPLDQLHPRLVVLPGDDVPTTGPFAWLSYAGHWGEQAPAFNNGPTGPMTKSQWTAPVTWVEHEGRDSAVALPFAASRSAKSFCNLTTKGSMLFNRILAEPVAVLALVALAALVVVVVIRRSSRGVLGRAVRMWRADPRRLLRVGTLVIPAAAAGGIAQWVLLRWTRVGTLVDAVGASSAWVVPLLGLTTSIVVTPLLAWTAAATIRAVQRPDVRGPIVDVAEHRRPTIWTTLLVLVATELGVVAFPPLLVLVSRWVVGPVESATDGTTTRTAVARSHRAVRGHSWRALGMVVTLLLVASVAGVIGALVLLLTSLSFAAAEIVVALVGVVLVPYLVLILVGFHDDITAPQPPRNFGVVDAPAAVVAPMPGDPASR